MKISKTFILLLILSQSSVEASIAHRSFGNYLNRFYLTQGLRNYPHLRIANAIMKEKFRRSGVDSLILSNGNAANLAPAGKASTNHVIHVEETKRQILRDFVTGKVTKSEYDEAIAHRWLPLAEIDPSGRSKLVRFASKDEFELFLETVHRPGYRFDPKTGQVYFDDFMALELHPEFSVLDKTQDDAIAWLLIHERAKRRLVMNDKFIHDVFRVVNDEWILRNEHRLDLAQLELDAIDKLVSDRRKAGLPDLIEDSIALERAQEKVKLVSSQLRTVDSLSEERVTQGIRRVAELIEEYTKLAMLDEGIAKVSRLLSEMETVLGAREARAVVKKIIEKADAAGPLKREKGS